MACVRCGGSGVLLEYIFHHGGVCFRCSGSGTDPQELNLIESKKIHKETIVAGKKVILTTKRDLHGRFMGYSVFIEGQLQHVNCKNIKKANTAFKKVVEQVKAGRQYAK